MKKISALILSLLIFLSVVFLPETVLATITANVSVSKKEVKPGETVSVTIGANVNLGTFECTIIYDASRMEYLPSSSSSGLSNPAEGRLRAAFATMGGVDVSAAGLFTAVFKVKNLEGSSVFQVTDIVAVNYAKEGINIVGASNSVNIKTESPPPPVTLPQTTTTTAPAQTPLAPVETIAPSTTATSAESTTTGTTKPFKAVDYAGRSLSLAEAEPEDLQLPGGFDPEEQIINGNRLSGFYSEEEDLFIAFLNRSDEEPCFYYYDSGCGGFIPYLRFALNEESYHIVFMPEDLMPHGTSRSSAAIRGLELPVLEFDSGEYVLLDDYMRQYQERLAENEAGDVNSHQTSSFFTETVTPIDVELDANDTGVFLIALRGKDKKIERFFYSEKIDQILNYDLLLVPAFGTFLDKDFYEKAPEKSDNPALQNETRTVTATTTAVPANSEQTESLLGGTVNLFGNNFKLWQIIIAAVVLLLIAIIVIIVIIRAVSRKQRAEYLFTDDFLLDESTNRSKDAHTYVDDDLDAEVLRSSDYTYPDDFPEVSELSDTDLEKDYFSEDYQENQYSERSEQEDQEEI